MRAPCDLFDSMLSLTTELFEPMEHALFFEPLLAQAAVGRVLDIGSGNGAYLARLQERYPRLDCLGVELEPNIYARSAARQRERLTFRLGSYEELSDPQSYDLVLARLVVPHLSDRRHLGSWLLPRVKPGGRLVILDADEDDLQHLDELPLFSQLYRRARTGLYRSPLMRLEDALRLELTSAGWTHLGTRRYQIRADRLEAKAQLYMYMRLVTEYTLRSPVPPAHAEELFSWLIDPDSDYNIRMFGMVFAPTQASDT